MAIRPPLPARLIRPQARYNAPLCHHFRGSRNPPEHLVEEFSIRSNLSQLGSLFDAYPLKPVQVVRRDEAGNRELGDCEWGLLPLW